MLTLKIKDQKLRKVFKKNENRTTILKFLYTNFLNKNKNESKKSLKVEPFLVLKQKNFSKTKIVRRCIINNRGRGSIRPFNISRIKLRELFQFGIIPGYKKAVW